MSSITYNLEDFFKRADEILVINNFPEVNKEAFYKEFEEVLKDE